MAIVRDMTDEQLVELATQRCERSREQSRRWLSENPERRREIQLKSKHGMALADKAALLEAQGGCCYLCGDELDLDKAIIEHDHRCCTGPYTCVICRRGLSCSRCNNVVGSALDDPDRLRRIADSLELAKELVLGRMFIRYFERP